MQNSIPNSVPESMLDYSEQSTNLSCPECGGTMYSTEDYRDGLIAVSLECEDCGYEISNKEE